MAGKANEMEGGVKWESSPHVGMENQRSTTPTRNALTYREVPTPDYEGMALYPSKQTKQK